MRLMGHVDKPKLSKQIKNHIFIRFKPSPALKILYTFFSIFPLHDAMEK